MTPEEKLKILEMTPEEYEKWVEQTNLDENNNVDIEDTKIVYRWDVDNFQYIGEYELQKDPVTPGQFLRPENCTDTRPPHVDENHVVVWDKLKSEWKVVINVHKVPVFEPETGEHVISPYQPNVDKYITKEPPCSKFFRYDYGEDKWVLKMDVLRKEYEREIRFIKSRTLSQPIETKYGVFNNLENTISVLTDYISIEPTKKVNIRDYSNKMVSLSLEDLKNLKKELINKREKLLLDYWKLKDSFDSDEETLDLKDIPQDISTLDVSTFSHDELFISYDKLEILNHIFTRQKLLDKEARNNRS